MTKYVLLKANEKYTMPSSLDSCAFGRFLKFWRAIRNLSQEEIAFRLDCSARHINRIENGNGHPSESLIEDLAERNAKVKA